LLRNTYLLLRCSASSAGCGGRVGSSHLLCELDIMLVNGYGIKSFFMSSSVHFCFVCRPPVSLIDVSKMTLMEGLAGWNG
jgi:hypothetical protein